MTTHTTEIHNNPYRCTTIGFDDGYPILLTLMDIVGAVGGSGLGSVLSLKALKDVDFSQFGDVFASLPRQLVKHGGSQLVKQLFALSKCERGMYLADGQITWQKLSIDVVRNSVFEANYLECFEALGWILKLNYAPFLTDVWARWGEPLQRWLNELEKLGMSANSEPLTQ